MSASVRSFYLASARKSAQALELNLEATRLSGAAYQKGREAEDIRRTALDVEEAILATFVGEADAPARAREYRAECREDESFVLTDESTAKRRAEALASRDARRLEKEAKKAARAEKYGYNARTRARRGAR